MSATDFTVPGPNYDGVRVPGICVLMRTKHYRDGHRITEPIGDAPDPEAAAAWIAGRVRSWSTDLSCVPEECPAYYFVPVPNGAP